MSSYLGRVPETISVPIKMDSDGYLGRECPNKDCLGYFKIVPGTGVEGPAPCHCPYCGFTGDQDTFFTRDQIEYATSVGARVLSDAVVEELKTLEFNYPAQGPFGLGFSMKVEPGPPLPIRHYREKQLETEVVCDHCTLRYAIYGVFAFCPDCRVHNSLQILNKNLDVCEKMLGLVQQAEPAMAEQMTGNVLEDAVSAFDGFGRETCRVRAKKATAPAKAENTSFQSLLAARTRVQELFGTELAGGVAQGEWDFACRCFQKRHLLAHKMGVVDNAYLQATADTTAVLGRKVSIKTDEVLTLIGLLRRLGSHLLTQLPTP